MNSPQEPDMTLTPFPVRSADPSLRARLRGRRFGQATAAIGLLVLAGWLLDLPLLRGWLPGQVETKANTALCLVLAGVALAWKSIQLPGSKRVRAANLFAGVVTLAGALTVVQYLLGWDFGIDQLLWRDASGAAGTVHPGRMALPTACSFLLLGWALLFLRPGRHSREIAWLTIPALLLALMAFVGQLYNRPGLMALGPFTPAALPTGVALLLLCAGILLTGSSTLAPWWERFGQRVGLAAALGLLLLMGGGVWQNARSLVRTNQQVAHTYEVLDRLSAVLTAMQDVETAARGYVLTGDEVFLAPYRTAPAISTQMLRDLRRLTADNPVQQQRLYQLEAHVDRKLVATAEQVAARRRGDESAAREIVTDGRGRRAMDDVRRDIALLRTEERRLLEERSARADANTARTLVTLGLGLGVAVLLLAGSFALLRQEVAERTRAEEALRRSEESLAVTLHSIGDAVMATDTAGRVTLLNPVAEKLTGWTLAEARGRPVGEVFTIINEQTRDPAPIPVADVLASGTMHELANHTALIARDGREHSIEDSAAPIRDAAGQLLGVVLVFRDVSDSRRVRQELDRFFTLSHDLLCIADQSGYFKRVSPGVSDALGWTVEEFLRTPYLELVHPDDREATLREVDKQMTRGEKSLKFENRYRHKDGSWRTLSWRSTPDLATGLMYGTARDVTERNRADARIRELHSRLQEHAVQLEGANKELESFSYSVSHDLRAPLRHIQGYVEMLARELGEAPNEKARRYLRTIADAGREMGDLIDDLLAFSRMGRTEMIESQVSLNPLIDEVRRGLELAVKDRNIEWRIAPLPPVRGDRAMLRQVFANLLGNAVKYSRDRSPAVIEIGQAGREEGRLVFFVRDNGAGFDMKYADKLFGVFQRLHRGDEFEGTGIGLASVRRIITRHGGRTRAEGRVDGGATFFFTLKPAPDHAA